MELLLDSHLQTQDQMHSKVSVINLDHILDPKIHHNYNLEYCTFFHQ
jgi:hypothetical protein